MNRSPVTADDITEILRRMQSALIERFGHAGRTGEERHGPEWALVQGVIGTRTKSVLSNETTDDLLERFGSWDAVAAASVTTLQKAMKRQRFPNQSAKRLKQCLGAIVEDRGSVDLRHLSNLPTDEAMAWLEALPGVGRKISAGIVNASTLGRPALVLDSHHLRIVRRMGLVPEKAGTEAAFDTLMPVMPPEWQARDFDEHHLLVKKLGQTLCKPSSMECNQCPLRADCATGQGASRH